MLEIFMLKILIPLLLLSQLCFAGKAEFSSFQTVTENPLIVVHASSYFNRFNTGGDALNTLISNSKSQGKEVVYLHSNRSSKKRLSGWYVEDKSPDLSLFSYQGENNLINNNGEFTVAGGFLGSDESYGCMTGTIIDLISNHFYNQLKVNSKPIIINVDLAASYTYGYLAWNKTLFKMLKDGETVNFLTFLMTAQPSEQALPEGIESQNFINMETLLSAKDEYGNASRDFWNVFTKQGKDNWALAGVRPSFKNKRLPMISTINDYQFIIQDSKKNIGYLGQGSKKIYLNFTH
jgi:hypothetical protein